MKTWHLGQVLDQFFGRHAYPEVLDGQGAGFVVRSDVDFQRQVVVVNFLLGELKVSELFQSIRSVGDQLAYKYLTIFI